MCMTTGGSGYLFEKTSNPKIATGDGLYLAYVAGCRLIDLEFIQFHPTGFKYSEFNYFLISEALRGEGAKLINSNGSYFMKSYHKQADLAPRDIVARAIYDQLNQNNTVYLDCRSLERNVIKKFPTITQKAKENNINLLEDLLPVTPVVHYIMGGILTNLNAQTDITNLYAIGEVACNGLHGANRLASNSLLEGIVFAKNAAASIKKVIKKTSHTKTKRKQINTETVNKKLRQKIQNLLWKNCGIIRNTSDLQKAANELRKLSKLSPFNKTPKNTQWLKLPYLFINAALHRKENCGSHFIGNQNKKGKYWITQCKFNQLQTYTQFPKIKA
jgi:L-aspartate oxidase